MSFTVLGTLLGTMRLPFLVLAPVCVSLGLATALASGQEVDWSLLPVVFIAAVAAHISVNMLNEYADFRSGLDKQTRRTPFSGGSGALPANPSALPVVLAAALGALLITVGCGFYLVFVRGWELLIVGVLGILLVSFYTPWINRSPWLCLIAPGLGFGTIVVLGTHWVLVGQLSVLAIMASFVPFLLTNNLLLLNQFPDLQADKSAGRRHLLITHGTFAGAIAYSASVIGCFMVILLGYVFKIWSAWALLSMLPILIAGFIASVVLREHRHVAQRQDMLALNVVATLLTPLVLALALVLG